MTVDFRVEVTPDVLAAREAMDLLAWVLEDVIEFLDRGLRQDLGFVGTESRLRTIIKLLDELVIGASTDPAVHLDRLRKDKALIEEQLARIEREGVVRPYSPTRIREQFATATIET